MTHKNVYRVLINSKDRLYQTGSKGDNYYNIDVPPGLKIESGYTYHMAIESFVSDSTAAFSSLQFNIMNATQPDTYYSITKNSSFSMFTFFYLFLPAADTQKKPLCEARFKQLAAARLKAAERKKEIGEISKKEKLLKQQILEERLRKLNELEEKAAAVKQQKQKVTTAKKKKQYDTSSDDESISSSSNSSSEDELPPPQTKSHKKYVAVAKEQVKHKPHKIKMSNEVVREHLKEKILRDNFKAAFASLFPNHVNIYE